MDRTGEVLPEKLYTITKAARLKKVAYNTITLAIIKGLITPRPNVEGVIVIPESELIKFNPSKKNGSGL